jgi:hypothetical protein
MSNSFKKNPICGHTTAKSDKKDKQMASRYYRRVCQISLNILGEDYQEKSSKLVYGDGNYVFAKDGKQSLADWPDSAHKRKCLKKIV